VDDNCDGTVDEVPWGSAAPLEVHALHGGLLGEGSRFYGLGYAISGTAEDVASTADILESTLLVDQDGAPDLLVSAPLGRLFGGEYGFFGQAVYLVAGGAPADMSGDSVATRTVLRLESDGGLTEFGAQVAWVESVDGDAIPEILVGAPAEGVEATEGLAYLFRSSDWDEAPLVETPEGAFVHVLDAADNALAIQGSAGDGFGVAASLGDWRGTGLGGVAVAASRAGAFLDAEVWVEPGEVYLFGSDLLGDTNRASVGTDEAVLVITGGREQQRVGAAAPALGDLDGDGLADLVVSSPEAAEGAGALAALLAGGSDISGEIDFLDMDLVLAASGSLTGLGQRLAAGGDLDGDGYGDVAAMATTASAHVFIEVVSGGRWGPPDAQDLAEVLLVEIDGVGLATGLDTVAFDLAADFNGDWYSDLAVGSAEGERYTGGGLVAVLYGMPGLAGSVNVQGLDARIVGGTSEWFGYTSLAGLDLTADGLPELVVGAPGYDALAAEHLRAGALYLLDPLSSW
jgi:hypothetical protein